MLVNPKNTSEKSIQHIVLFWLKNPSDTKSTTDFEESMNRFLNTSHFANKAHFGVPSVINRAVVDTSYTYCLTVTFKNMEAHDQYQIDPAHKLFIAECSHLWEKVLIYDSEVL